MRGRGLSRPAFWLALLLLAMWAPFAVAEARPADSPALHEHCSATGTRGESLAALAASSERWRCRKPPHELSGERAFLRFSLDRAPTRPRFLVAARSPLEAVHLLVIDADGTTRSRSYAADELEPAFIDGFFKVRLPDIGPQSRTVIAAIDLPTSRMTLAQAHLAPNDPGDHPSGHRFLILLAVLCGMLLMPPMFDAAFYRILREPFVLWHSALVVSLLLTVLTKSGLSLYLIDLPVITLSKLTTLAFGLAVASGAMFAHSFIEPDKLNRALRRALPVAAAWSMFISSGHALFPFILRPVQVDLYYAGYAPVLVLLICVLADALRRGSRAAKFQVIGWSPLLGVGVARLVTGLVPTFSATDAMTLFYFGCVFEVLATTLGVADRFMALKDQRDLARTEAHLLERLSERDALTGLLNRRVIDDRFELLRAQGFTALAVIDLDHFKAVNDRHGHATGDEVLRLAATALAPTPDMLAFRLGGEEFMLLLRGRDSLQRAEARRRAITARVAAGIEGLDRPVTASMGVVEVPSDAMPGAVFEDLYARADRLLYEAKQAGRNRSMSERMKTFVARRRDRRMAAA